MNIALILSGGAGTRLGGDIPKQYIEIGGKAVISYCMDKLLQHDMIDAVQIVADEAWHDRIFYWVQRVDQSGKFRGFSEPGANRQLSIFHALEDIRQYASDRDYVFIHDAARPLLTEEMITECLSQVEPHDGVLPVLPMKDTVYLSEDGKRVSSLLDRAQIYAGQAPEVFRLKKYYEANKNLIPEEILNINGSTEPAIRAGMDIVMIPGDERNFKITTKEDLEHFRQIVEREQGNSLV